MSDWATFAAGISGTVVGVAATLLVDRLGAKERDRDRRAEAVDRAIDSVTRFGLAMAEHSGKSEYPDEVAGFLLDASRNITGLTRWGAPADVIETALELSRRLVPETEKVELLNITGKVGGVLNGWLVRAEAKERRVLGISARPRQ